MAIQLTSAQAAELVYNFLSTNGLSLVGYNLEHDLLHALLGAGTDIVDELLVTSVEEGSVMSYERCVEITHQVNKDYNTSFTLSTTDYQLLVDRYNSSPIKDYSYITHLTGDTKWWDKYVEELDYLVVTEGGTLEYLF